MLFRRWTAFFSALLFTSFGLAQQAAPTESDEEKKLSQIIVAGAQLSRSNRHLEAIEKFDQVIASYEDKYKEPNTLYMAARTEVESLFYLLDMASKQKQSGKMVSVNWAYAHYLKAYSLLDLQKLDEGKISLQRALAMSPRNSQFLSELGNIHQREKNWPIAIETFQQADAAAQEFSPAFIKNEELSRAWRGIGYSLIEQGKLDDAEAIYQKCLNLNANDQRALGQLRYIASVRNRPMSKQ
jgi:tetratricopeptide (TPR) repeat protein